MSRQEVIFMVAASLISIILAAIGINRYETMQRKRENPVFIGIARKNKVQKIYLWLENNRVMGGITKRVAQQYAMIYPSLHSVIATKTVFLIGLLCTCDFLLLILVYLVHPDAIHLLTLLVLIYVIQNSIMSGLLKKAEVKMLEQLDLGLSDLKHYYLATNHIGSALWYTLERGGDEIKAHIEKLFYIIDSPYEKLLSDEYNDEGNHRYLKLLLEICVKTAEQGDSRNEKKESVFTANINILKRSVRKEIEKIKRINFIFAGLTFVAVSPVLTLGTIKNWAVGNLEELNQFYSGKMGFYIAAASLWLTFFIYALLKRLRDTEDIVEKNYSFLIWFGKLSVIRWVLERERVYRTVLKQQELLRRLGEKESGSVLQIRRMLYGIFGFLAGLFFIVHACQQEKLLGLNEGGNFIRWYEIILLFILSGVCYCLPYWMLLLKRQFLEDYMNEEVMCFQTVLSMQIYLRGSNLMDMLKSMEMFAKVFKPSLQNCINNMLRDEIGALAVLQEEERFPPFQRLMDCFLMSDATDIPTAFDEVCDDIRYFQDVYDMELDMILKRKSDAAEILAFIPGMFILICYLIVPFVGAGMAMFESSFQQNMGMI